MIEFKGHIARAEDKTVFVEDQSFYDQGVKKHRAIMKADFVIATNGPYPLELRDLIGKRVRVIIED